MKKVISFLEKFDTFVEEKSHKVHFVLFDIVVLLLTSIISIFGIILMFICSFWCGLSIMVISYGFGTYLLMKRHKKHLDKWMN